MSVIEKTTLSPSDLDNSKMWHIMEKLGEKTLCGKIIPGVEIQGFQDTSEIECIVCLDIWHRIK